ncbi:MAG: cation transporter [Microbacteriaceae bacterium]|nr:cation transporter [Microbacteriaceae bacterium]
MIPAARHPAPQTATELLRRGKLLAFSTSSVALAGFGLDSAIEIGASTVVLWELSGTDTGARKLRQQKALRLIGVAFLLFAALKTRTGRTLRNPVLELEGRVTLIDGLLALAVLCGIVSNRMLGWWWADPLAGLVIVHYAIREAVRILRPVTPTHA